MLKKFFHHNPLFAEKKKLVQHTYFGFYLAQNAWGKQETAFNYYSFDPKDTLSLQINKHLSPNDIGHRLWSSHQALHERMLFKKNVAASTTIYDGRGNFITASSTDFYLFLAIYDEYGYPFTVIHLNPMMVKRENPSKDRLGTRIHIHNLYQRMGKCRPEVLGKIQLIYCEAQIKTWSSTKQEAYMLRALQMNDPIGTVCEEELAKKLCEEISQDIVLHNPNLDGSEDNISFLIQRIDKDTPPFLFGLCKNKAMDLPSKMLADNLLYTIQQECSIANKAYAKQRLSVHNNQYHYNMDNGHIAIENLIRAFTIYKTGLTDKTTAQAIHELLTCLKNEDFGYLSRAKIAYSLLATPRSEMEDLSLIAFIKSTQTSDQAEILFKNILQISRSQLPGLLPNLLISSLVFLITGEYVEDLKLKSLALDFFCVPGEEKLLLNCEQKINYFSF